MDFLLTIFFFFCCGMTALYDFHCFQLNSYKMNLSLTGDIKKRILPILFILPVWLLEATTALPIAACAAFALQGWLNRPRPTKKPLIHTPRVRRMLFTQSLLMIFLVTASRGFNSVYANHILTLAILFCLNPLWMYVANIINMPVERAINRWYINDAKRILAENPALMVIGITGSYGKTSAKHFLRKILSAKYNVLMTPENYNTTLGVVRSVRENLRPVHNVFICEMGARGVGQIKEICDIVHPRHGLITSIGPQHLEFFKTLDNIVKTKFELAESLPPGGLAFLNYDNSFIRDYPLAGPKVTYALDNGTADYQAGDIAVSLTGSSFRATLSDGVERLFETTLIGRHNVQNIIGAIAVADTLGVPPEDIALAVRRLESVPHRLQLLRRGGMTVIDDAYNSNAAGAKAALETLAMFDACKILATPGMIELGAVQDECNFQLGVQAAEICDYVILAGEQQTSSILKGLQSKNFPADKIFIAENLRELFAQAQSVESAGRPKVLLLENDLPDTY